MGAQHHPADADADAMQDHTWKTSLKNVLFLSWLHVTCKPLSQSSRNRFSILVNN